MNSIHTLHADYWESYLKVGVSGERADRARAYNGGPGGAPI